MPKKINSIEYLNTLKNLITKNGLTYLEMTDNYNNKTDVFDCDNADNCIEVLQDQINGIVSGEISVCAYKSKKIKTIKAEATFLLTNNPIKNFVAGTNDTKLEFELFKRDVLHQAELQKLKNEVEIQDEQLECSQIDKWLNHPIIGKIITPVLESKGEQIAGFIAGLIDTSIGINKNSIAGITGTPAEEKIKMYLGSFQYNIMMNGLADLLEKDTNATIEKIKSIFL